MKPEPAIQIASECHANSSAGISDPSATAEVRIPAGNRPGSSIRLRLASLVVACVLPVWIAAGFLIYYNYQSRRAFTEQRMLETARALAVVVDQELANIQAGLSVLATAPSLVSGDLPTFYHQAHSVVEAHPSSRIFLADASGQEHINTFLPFGVPLPKHSVPGAVRLVYTTRRPMITKAFWGVLDGRFLIGVHVPVVRNNLVVYDLAMIVPADRFAEVLLHQHLPPEWVGSILDSDNVIVARTRLPEKFVGRPIGPILRQRMTAATEGTAEVPNLEGTLVFDSFSRSATTGWTLVIGVPKAVMAAEAWRWLWWTLTGTALLSLTGIALALPIGRSVEQIERGSRRLSDLVESSDDAIVGKTLEGVVTSWNLGAVRLYGYSAAEMSGQPISVLIPADRPDEGSEILLRIIKGEYVEHYETVRRRKDGSLVDVSLTVSPIWDASGNIVGASAIARDITERKRAEQALHESERKARAIFDSTFQFTGLLTPEGILVDANHTALAFAGARLEDVIDRPFWDTPWFRGAAVRVQQLQKAIREGSRGTFVRYEVELQGAGDTSLPVDFSLKPIFDSDGKSRLLICEARDISERKRANAEMAKARTQAELTARQLRTIVDTVPIGLHVRDADGRIILQNDTTRNIYGINEQDLPPLSEMSKWVELYELDGRPVPFSEWPMSRILRGEHVRSTELRVCSKEIDKERILSYTGLPVLDSNGKVVMAVMTSEDITERKREEEQREELEQKLRQAQKMEAVGRLAGGIAHDFNNLLMVIQSYTEMLRDKLPADDPLRRNTQAVLKAAGRAAGLTRQMLAYSRKQILSPVLLDLNAVVHEAAKMITRLIGEDIEFQLSLAESLWAIKADSDQIVQVLMNLCLNARDAMPQGGVLAITTGNVTLAEESIGGQPYIPSGDYVKLSVSDTGTGIPKEIQDQIFEPFFTTKEVGKGTGLGLATVYGIVKQSGGYVWVDSEPGRGARFSIYLPKADEIADSEAQAKTEARSRGTETILVTEDEEPLREAMCDFLRSLKYKVLEAGSGHEAVSVATEHAGRIDLLITDVVMPKMSGRELAKLLGQLRPELKTIYMSGYTDDAVLRHGIHEVGATFLQKPFNLSTLARKVRDQLGPTETVQ